MLFYFNFMMADQTIESLRVRTERLVDLGWIQVLIDLGGMIAVLVFYLMIFFYFYTYRLNHLIIYDHIVDRITSPSTPRSKVAKRWFITLRIWIYDTFFLPIYQCLRCRFDNWEIDLEDMCTLVPYKRIYWSKGKELFSVDEIEVEKILDLGFHDMI